MNSTEIILPFSIKFKWFLIHNLPKKWTKKLRSKTWFHKLFNGYERFKHKLRKTRICGLCGNKKAAEYYIHHVDSQLKFPHRKKDTTNLVLLCKVCHKYADQMNRSIE